MGTSCTQLHMFYVANKSRVRDRCLMHLFVILFFNLLQTTQCLVIYYNILQYVIYCNILQYVIY